VAKCDWAIVCDHAFFDEERKICMVGVFDRIFAKSVPATHLQAFLVLKLVGEPKEKARVKVDIVRPTGDVLGKIEGTSELGDDGTSQLKLGMRGLPLPDFGIYAVNIYIADQLEKTIGITVSRTPESIKSG
jgi:hypothetical protein